MTQIGVCGADGCEQHQEQSDDDGVRDQHARIAERRRIGMKEFHAHGGQACGMMSNPDWTGV